MARMFTKDDCTAWTYDSVTGLLNQLGSGSITVEGKEITNEALLDTWTDSEVGPLACTVEAEFAAEAADVWFSKAGGSATLTITTSSESITGTFICLSSRLSTDDAMRYSVTLKNKGTVTIS